MSAFIVSDDHINALMNYCIANRIDFYNPATRDRTQITTFNAGEIGRILMDENVRSVCHRYADAGVEEKNAAADYRFKLLLKYHHLKPVQVIKACHCLDYQSCETPDWEGTLAHRILQTIISHATHRLAGYDDAAWEIRA